MAVNLTLTGALNVGTPLTIANGGTGITTVPTNGQLMIGNGSGYTAANLTAGANITITNSAGGESTTQELLDISNF